MFGVDSKYLPLQEQWPLNLVAYVLRLSALSGAGSVAGLVVLLVISSPSRFPIDVLILPLSLLLVSLGLNRLALRLLISEVRQLLAILREGRVHLREAEMVIKSSRLLVQSDPVELAVIAENEAALEKLKQKSDELRDRLEDILTAPSLVSPKTKKVVLVGAMIREMIMMSQFYNRPPSQSALS